MGKVENYTVKAIQIANDNSHGYSQINRWGNPDYDCSGLVITVVNGSGIPVKKNGATYTGNMFNAFIKSGFRNVTSTVNLKTGVGLKRGDVLLKPNSHTEIYIGNGKNVGAHISEKGTKHGKQGDQTGREISITKYYNKPWTYVLRFPETPVNSVNNSVNNSNEITVVAKDCIKGKYGNGYYRSLKIYQEVQKEVNNILNKRPLKNNEITVIAKDCIKGKYGNGEERKRNIYKTVQKEINKLLTK